MAVLFCCCTAVVVELRRWRGQPSWDHSIHIQACSDRGTTHGTAAKEIVIMQAQRPRSVAFQHISTMGLDPHRPRSAQLAPSSPIRRQPQRPSPRLVEGLRVPSHGARHPKTSFCSGWRGTPRGRIRRGSPSTRGSTTGDCASATDDDCGCAMRLSVCCSYHASGLL